MDAITPVTNRQAPSARNQRLSFQCTPTLRDPEAEASERCILGSVMENPPLLSAASDLSVNDFYSSSHRQVYGLCLELAEQGKSFDAGVIAALLEERGQLESVGGHVYLSELLDDAACSADHIRHHVRIMINAARLRNYRRVGVALEEASRQKGADHALLQEKFSELLNKLGQGYDLNGKLTPVVPRNLKKRADIIRLDAVEALDVEWVWEPYVPKGMLSMFTGDPDVGKSYVALAISADLSNGRIPYSGQGCEPQDTLYLTVENAAEYVLRPRFNWLNGDPKRFHLLRGSITGPDGDKAIHGSVCLSDVALLDEALQSTKAKFVVVDPIQSYLGAEVKMGLANETRPILDGLVRLAQRHQCAILLLRHATKSASTRAIYRGQGSIDFGAAVRTEMLLGKLPDNPQRRSIVQLQSNIGRIGNSIGYEIDEHGHFFWNDASGVTAGTLLAGESDPETKSALEEAVEFLQDALAKDPQPQKQLIREARELGIAERTLRRAKLQLKVKSRKSQQTDGVWEWWLS